MLKTIALNTITSHNLIENKDHIIVGVSGGADSISLLHFLKDISGELELSLTAVHINHGVRQEEAIRDLKFVQNFCKEISIPLEIFNFDIPKEAKKLSISEEEAGRLFRYKAFNEVLEKNNAQKIAVAHNKDDNAETLLLNLFRGAGLKGLCGISFKRENIIRPLLDCSRAKIENYCLENNLNYVTDSTNNLEIYTRNKIRLNVIPYLSENFNKNIISALSNTANTLKEEEAFLDKIAKKHLEEITIEKNSSFWIININLLKNLDVVLIKRIFRIICLNFNKNLNNISSKHINMLLNLLDKQSGKSVNLPNNISFKKEHNTFFVTNLNFSTNNYNYQLPLDKKIYIKELNKYIYLTKKCINSENLSKKVYTIPLNYDIMKDILLLRNRINGDKIFLKGIKNYKKLKDLFIDLKVPAHKRNSIPIITHNDEIVAVLGYVVSDIFKPNEKTKNIIYVHFGEE